MWEYGFTIIQFSLRETLVNISVSPQIQFVQPSGSHIIYFLVRPLATQQPQEALPASRAKVWPKGLHKPEFVNLVHGDTDYQTLGF